MTFEGIKGQDIRIEATSSVILRIQGHQWRLAKPASGVATLDGAWTRALTYYGGKPIMGDVWIGKTKHRIKILPRG